MSIGSAAKEEWLCYHCWAGVLPMKVVDATVADAAIGSGGAARRRNRRQRCCKADAATGGGGAARSDMRQRCDWRRWWCKAGRQAMAVLQGGLAARQAKALLQGG